MKKRHGIGKEMVALLVVICVILAFSATAYAVNLFGLKNLVMKSPTDTVTYSRDTAEGAYKAAETADKTGTATEDLIALQGYPDSNEYKAVSEWTVFRDNYDKDGAIIAKIGNGPTGLDAKYSMYPVYTQQMADKLDEIASKYGLTLHSSIADISSAKELISRVGRGDFLGPINKPSSTYMYEDGTFHFDGSASLQSGLKIDYQFMNCKKGSFTDTILNIGNADNYKEWSYKTASGVTVSLAISPKKSLVIADLKSSFMTINVLAGTETGFLDESGKITAHDLETLADSFDFSMLN